MRHKPLGLGQDEAGHPDLRLVRLVSPPLRGQDSRNRRSAGRACNVGCVPAPLLTIIAARR